MKIYDAIIVGSGAAGGMAAKILTEGGMKVLLLEAGPAVKRGEFQTHSWPYDFPFRGRGHPKVIAREGLRVASEYTPLEGFYARSSENPYTTPPDKPFEWIRSRILGGRTLHWGRQSFRLADYDFKAASRDGYGVDWPFTYQELAPYYDQVESYIGVQGIKEGLRQIPDGNFLPPMPMNCFEQIMRKAARKSGWPLTTLRTAQLSRPHRGRLPCHYCGGCNKGCDVGAFFSTPEVTLPDAMQTGNLTLRTDAVVRHVVVDENGHAKGVGFFHRVDKSYQEVFGNVIVLAASTFESTRIMLNSRSRFHPNGLANSSGVLGHHATDHFTAGTIVGVLPQLKAAPVRNDDGKAGGSYIPRFRNVQDRHPKFIRGYAIMVKGGCSIYPSYASTIKGLGAEFKQKVREFYPAVVRVYTRGEPLQRFENYVELDPEVTDAWGIPVLKIHSQHGDNEKHILDDAFESLRELMHNAGAEILQENKSLSKPGQIIHEMGTCRMGNDPKSSVLNKFNQGHDVANLFVIDAACWPSSTCQNPTETILAIAWRASEYLLEQYRIGNLQRRPNPRAAIRFSVVESM